MPEGGKHTLNDPSQPFDLLDNDDFPLEDDFQMKPAQLIIMVSGYRWR